MSTVDDIRMFVIRHPNNRIALSWGQMLDDDADGYEGYTLYDYIEEAEIQVMKAHATPQDIAEVVSELKGVL